MNTDEDLEGLEVSDGGSVGASDERLTAVTVETGRDDRDDLVPGVGHVLVALALIDLSAASDRAEEIAGTS